MRIVPRRVPHTVLVVVLALVGGCNESEDVDLTFRAELGERLAYDVTATSTAHTVLGAPGETTREELRLVIEQQVARSGPDDVELDISITREGERTRHFEMRLDPVAGLAEIETVEGLPLHAIGDLGGSRLVLLGGGLLPNERIRPGRSWPIRRVLELDGVEVSVTGSGRLTGLRTAAGIHLARVEITTDVPIEQSLNLPEGLVRVRGIERTRAVIEVRVSDGTVERVESETTGRFDLEVDPPGGRAQDPLRGTLEVSVSSTGVRSGDGPRDQVGGPMSVPRTTTTSASSVPA